MSAIYSGIDQILKDYDRSKEEIAVKNLRYEIEELNCLLKHTVCKVVRVPRR